MAQQDGGMWKPCCRHTQPAHAKSAPLNALLVCRIRTLSKQEEPCGVPRLQQNELVGECVSARTERAGECAVEVNKTLVANTNTLAANTCSSLMRPPHVCHECYIDLRQQRAARTTRIPDGCRIKAAHMQVPWALAQQP